MMKQAIPLMKQAFLASLLVLGAATVALADEMVNINTATVEQLADSLSGVGESKARAIVEYREMHGAFEHIDELVNVRGIGLATVDQNRDRIELDQNSDG